MRRQRRRPRGPVAGDGRREPLRWPRRRRAPRRPPGALIVLGGRVRSIGKGGERSEPLEDFLATARRTARPDVAYEEPAASAFAALGRPHTRHYSILAVAGARATDGTFARGHRRRLRTPSAAAVEQSDAADDALADVEPPDDALASAWYRKTVLPTLVPRALDDLEEAA